jgi:hypothetical protein
MNSKDYYDRSLCKKRSCTDWRNRMCIDPKTYRINGTGNICCRYHPDAVTTDK